MPKILFNGLMYEKQGTGISVYTKRILDIYLKDKKFNINTLVRKQYKEEYQGIEKAKFSTKTIQNSKDRILYEQLWGVKQYNQYDLIHFPDYSISLLSKAKKVITIQDMAMFTMKEAYTPKQVLVKQFLLKQSLKRVHGIVCSSQYAKQELLRYFPKLRQPIEVIYPGLEAPKQVCLSQKEKEDILDKFKINKPYILFVGTLAPSKNIINLIKGFELIREQNLDYQLVICGKKGWMYEELFDLKKKSKYERDIIFTDFVDDQELEILYEGAKLFSSASLYEGFGFPPLEAMQRKVPVAVSDLEIFKETCEDAALYYDPNDIYDIAKILKNVLQDATLQQVLISKGKKRVERFSTQKTVQSLYEFYQEILDQGDKHKLNRSIDSDIEDTQTELTY